MLHGPPPADDSVPPDLSSAPEEYRAMVQAMFQQLPELWERLPAMVEEADRLWASEFEIVKRVLRCHLLIEHRLRQYLVAANPALGDLEPARLRFEQLVLLAAGARTTSKALTAGILNVNRLRNRLAHNLDANLNVTADLAGHSLDGIDAFLRLGGYDPRTLSGVERVEFFSRLACFALNVNTSMIRERAPDLGMPGLHAWINKLKDDHGPTVQAEGS